MKLFNTLLQQFTRRPRQAKKPGNDGRVTSGGNDSRSLAERLRERERELYGEDHLAEQRLFERWVCKESWRLRSEALPLFFGIDPEKFKSTVDAMPELENELATLWSHARQCVEQGLLEVINKEKDPDDWKVRPLVAYKWAAVSRVKLPETLVPLMDFIATSVKREDTGVADATNVNDASVSSEQFDSDREKILGMALAILAAFPEQTRNSKGRININRLMSIMGEKKEFWIGNETLSLSEPAIRDLLNKWLATLP